VASLRIVPDSAGIQVGGTVDLDAEARSASGAVLTGRTVTWTSLNTAVATVNPSTGLVTGVAPGKATIRATSEGVTADAVVTVTAVPPAPVVATPSGLSASKANNGNRIELTWTDNANNETRYEVYRSTTANVTASTANRIGGDLPADTKTYIDDTVNKNVTYYYRVRACNTTGCSNLSNEDSEKL
jgi:uncharacterized protein YjdB